MGMCIVQTPSHLGGVRGQREADERGGGLTVNHRTCCPAAGTQACLTVEPPFWGLHTPYNCDALPHSALMPQECTEGLESPLEGGEKASGGQGVLPVRPGTSMLPGWRVPG